MCCRLGLDLSRFMERKEHTLDRSVHIGSSSPNCGLLCPLHLSPLDELIEDSLSPISAGGRRNCRCQV